MSASKLDAKVLMEVLMPVRHKWYAIGLSLGYSVADLSTIMSEHTNVTQRLGGVCERCEEDASWESVVTALRSVQEHSLADLLHQEHCLESISKTWVSWKLV